MRTRVIRNNDMDVWRCFAIESYLVKHIEADEVILYLWQSEKNVMLGKHQNPWRECNVKLLEKEQGKLARRTTGGGAIYCDEGSLLFSFILPKKYYDVDRQLQVILDACLSLGIKAEKSGRNDLIVNGRKFSGNAFYHNSKVSLHHGSLLFDVNIDDMVKYLTPSYEKVTSKGIQSVRSRVTNLCNINDRINVESLQKSLSDSFVDIYPSENTLFEDDPEWFDCDEIQATYQTYKSWDWCYGRASEADLILEKRFEWGEIQLHLKLVKSIVSEVVIYSDALDPNYIEGMSKVFEGTQFESELMSKAIKGYGDTPERCAYSENISTWLKENIV